MRLISNALQTPYMSLAVVTAGKVAVHVTVYMHIQLKKGTKGWAHQAGHGIIASTAWTTSVTLHLTATSSMAFFIDRYNPAVH